MRNCRAIERRLPHPPVSVILVQMLMIILGVSEADGLTSTQLAALAAAGAAVVGLLILIGQWVTASRQARRDQVRLLRTISATWRSLRDDWNVALMVARGPDDYYVEVAPERREAYRSSLAELEKARGRSSGAVRRAIGTSKSYTAFNAWVEELGGLDEAKDHPDFEERFGKAFQAVKSLFAPTSRAVQEISASLASYRLAVRSVLRFLSEVSGLVLRGRIDTAVVYEALGPEVVRNGGAIRAMMEKSDNGWVSVHPGLRARVLILIDLMWAHAAETWDLRLDRDFSAVAKAKRDTGSGARNRLRCRSVARTLGGRRVAHRLDRLLRTAEQVDREPPAWHTLLERPKESDS